MDETKYETDPELLKLLETSRERVAKMTDAERAAMIRAQRESWVRAEMSWPQAKYTFVDGVKVYASFEDYCND